MTAKNDAKYEPTYQARCTERGHTYASDTTPPPAECPMFWHGKPCGGTLVRFGKGSQS